MYENREREYAVLQLSEIGIGRRYHDVKMTTVEKKESP